MKVTIRLSTEISYSVTIPDNSTVQDLRSGAKVACPSTSRLPQDFKVIYNGEKLTPLYRTLASFGIEGDDNTVILMSESVELLPSSASHESGTKVVESGDLAVVGGNGNGGATAAAAAAAANNSNNDSQSQAPRRTKKKNRCSFESCNAASLRMVGNCSHCHGCFCAKHRLLEDHMCQGLQFCKDNAHERNAMKLENERTLASRV